MAIFVHVNQDITVLWEYQGIRFCSCECLVKIWGEVCKIQLTAKFMNISGSKESALYGIKRFKFHYFNSL